MGRKKVLIVEDEEWIRKSMEAGFRLEDFDVLIAQNGLEGLELAQKEHPDIILLDLVMPKMDGMEMLKRLKADEKFKNIPAIILTNFPDNEKIAEATALGGFDFLLKSDWEVKDLVKKVKEKLAVK